MYNTCVLERHNLLSLCKIHGYRDIEPGQKTETTSGYNLQDDFVFATMIFAHFKRFLLFCLFYWYTRHTNVLAWTLSLYYNGRFLQDMIGKTTFAGLERLGGRERNNSTGLHSVLHTSQQLELSSLLGLKKPASAAVIRMNLKFEKTYFINTRSLGSVSLNTIN